MSGQQRWFDRPSDANVRQRRLRLFVPNRLRRSLSVRPRVGSCGMGLFCLGAFTFCRAYRMSTMNFSHSLESLERITDHLCTVPGKKSPSKHNLNSKLCQLLRFLTHNPRTPCNIRPPFIGPDWQNTHVRATQSLSGWRLATLTMDYADLRNRPPANNTRSGRAFCCSTRRFKLDDFVPTL